MVTSHSGYRWIDGGDYWLEIIVIAAPLMVLFGVLIAHRVYNRKSPSPIYKPCHYSHSYEPVYVPTTCTFDKTYVVNDRYEEQVLINATDSSVIGVAERGNWDLCCKVTNTKIEELQALVYVLLLSHFTSQQSLKRQRFRCDARPEGTGSYVMAVTMMMI